MATVDYTKQIPNVKIVPSAWHSRLGIGDEKGSELGGTGHRLACLFVGKDVSKWRVGDVLVSQYVLRKDATNVNRPAKSVPKPTPVIYEPGVLIEAENRVDKHL